MENKNVADEFIVESVGGSFLKGADFDGDGLKLEVVKMEKFTPKDDKYGVKNTYGAGGVVTKEHCFIKNNLLKEGESFKYTFKSEDVEKSFDNSSLGFYFTFVKAELQAGDIVLIKRNKISETKVDWSMTKI